MMSGGDVRLVISGISKPEQATKWIDEGAQHFGAGKKLEDEVDIALDLFNLAGFEPSSGAAFLVHCTALEQLFPREAVDALSRAEIEAAAAGRGQRAAKATTEQERSVLLRLQERILDLKRESISKAVQDGVARTLSSPGSAEATALAQEVRDIYRTRSTLAHEGRVDLGSAPARLKDILSQVILARVK